MDILWPRWVARIGFSPPVCASTGKPAEIGLAPLQVRDIADAGGLDTLADALAKAMDKRTASRCHRPMPRNSTGVIKVTMQSTPPPEDGDQWGA